MPTFDTDEGTFLRDTVLAGFLGPNRGALAPDSWIIHLWMDDPRGDSPREADFGNYLPVEWDSDLWLPPSEGRIFSDGLLDFGTPDVAATDSIRFWSMNRVTNDLPAHSFPFKTPRAIGVGSNPVQLQLEVPCNLYG